MIGSTSSRWVEPYTARARQLYRTPAGCVFVTQVDFLHAALAAYKGAQRDLWPDGDTWLDADGNPAADAESFFESLMFRLGESLRRRALLTGHLVEVRDGDNDWMGCRGAAPADMAQGSAAFASAVGPAQGAGQGQADAQPADPLFSGPEEQELPPVAAGGTLKAAQEAASL